MGRSSSPTRVERVYNALRGDILAGRRPPGTRLLLADLLGAYQASMGVVREALTRLQGEGLVEAEPQYGFHVIAISDSSLRHLTEARCVIETLVLRSSIANGGIAWESDVLAAHHRLDRTPQMDAADPSQVSEEWSAAHAAFHLALLAACPNPFLLSSAVSMRDSAELYRRWSVPRDESHRDIPAEHRGLLEAALAHDADAAAELLTRHIQRTTDILLERSARVPSDLTET